MEKNKKNQDVREGVKVKKKGKERKKNKIKEEE